MKAYDIFRTLLSASMIVTAATSLFICLFSIPTDPYGKIYIFSITWYPHIDIPHMALVMLLPIGLWALWTKPLVSDLIPVAGIFFGICTIIIGVYHIDQLSNFFEYFGDVLLGIGMIVSSLSFKRGFLHTTMRMVLLIGLLLLMAAIRIALAFVMLAGHADILFMILRNADNFLYIFTGIPLICICLYPEDLPGVRLNHHLRDLEYTKFNKAEMYISAEGLAGISGKDLSGWTGSQNPSIESEYLTELYGSKARYIVRQQKWKGDDGIYLSIVTDRGTSITSGTGAKIVYIANDNTVSSLKGQPVRIYTQEHTFLRVIVLDFPVVQQSRYKLQLDKFFQDF